MLKDALVITLFVALIVFVITLIVLCIKLINTVNKIDYLVDNVTTKVESLDGIFNILSFASNKLSVVSDTITSFLLNLVNKIFRKNKKDEGEEENE